MYAKVLTSCIDSLSSFVVTAEVHILGGLPHFQIVGLADNAVREAKDRIRSAILQSGFEYPMKQIIVNLTPNDKPKGGSLCEVAIAVGILMATGQINKEFFEDKLILGSLSLDGSIHDSRGIMGAAIAAIRQREIKTLLVPHSIGDKLQFLPELRFIPLSNLRQFCQVTFLKERQTTAFQAAPNTFEVDMKEIQGQEQAKKALAIAAIGRHHLLLIGSQGSGKTMLARAFNGLLPPMTLKEALEVTEIYTGANMVENQLIQSRPLRIPHHTTSDIALIGGGSRPMAGEISLAHRGILFLDELLEFSPHVIQSLREPLEQKIIRISRAKGHLILPADFIFIGATNHCPCGNYNSRDALCTCEPRKTLQLLQKIRGPFLDRISLEVELMRQPENIHWIRNNNIPDTAWWASKIQEAILRMLRRNQGRVNNELKLTEITDLISDREKNIELIKQYHLRLNLSHRSLINSLQAMVSLADFNGQAHITEDLIHEIFSYRVIKKYHDSLTMKNPLRNAV